MADTKIVKRADGTLLIERFPPIRRVEHILVILTFVVLVMTGFPQKFYEASWATGLLNFFGGLDKARVWHRVTGIIFTFHAFVHMGAIAVGVASEKMRLTLLPTSRDFRDVFATLRYYFGQTNEHPQYGKYDYRQKFEYLGLVLGGLIMISSGLILLFPGWTSSFAPGQLIPAARLAHSNEALLAFCVLVVWHVYGSHLSPDVFPMDTSVFTGYMTEEQLKKHHVLEYYRLFPDKKPAPGSESSDHHA